MNSFDTCFERSTDKKDGVKKKDIAHKFKEWYRDAHDGETAPKTKTLNEYFEKILKLKYSATYGYVGIKYKKEYETISEDSADEPEVVKSKKNDLDEY